jgi:hypothetical protein
MLFKQIAKRPHESGPVARRHARPWARLKGPPRRCHGKIDIRLITRGNVADHLLCCRIFYPNSFAAMGIYLFAVDQHVMFLGQKCRCGIAERWFQNCYSHRCLPSL